MATGYTAKLCDREVSFQDFVLSCSKAFTQEDDRALTGWKVDQHYEEEIQKARKEIGRIKGLSDEACDAEATVWLRKEREKQRAYKEKQAKTKERLLSMKEKVVDWKIPSKDHQPLKEFMLQQLQDALDHEFVELKSLPETYSGKEWKRDQLEELKDTLEFYTKGLSLEIQRVTELNRWFKELRGSLV